MRRKCLFCRCLTSPVAIAGKTPKCRATCCKYSYESIFANGMTSWLPEHSNVSAVGEVVSSLPIVPSLSVTTVPPAYMTFSTAIVASGRTSSKHNPTIFFMNHLSWICLAPLSGALGIDAASELPDQPLSKSCFFFARAGRPPADCQGWPTPRVLILRLALACGSPTTHAAFAARRSPGVLFLPSPRIEFQECYPLSAGCHGKKANSENISHLRITSGSGLDRPHGQVDCRRFKRPSRSQCVRSAEIGRARVRRRTRKQSLLSACTGQQKQRQAPRRRVEFRHPGGWRPPGEPDHHRGRTLRTHSNPESFRFGCRDGQALVEIRLGNTRNAAQSRARVLGRWQGQTNSRGCDELSLCLGCCHGQTNPRFRSSGAN